MSFFFFQAEDGIRDRSPSRGLGDVYKRQGITFGVSGFGWLFVTLIGVEMWRRIRKETNIERQKKLEKLFFWVFIIHICSQFVLLVAMIVMFLCYQKLKYPAEYSCFSANTTLTCNDLRYKEKSNLNIAIIVVFSVSIVFCLLTIIHLAISKDELSKLLLGNIEEDHNGEENIPLQGKLLQYYHRQPKRTMSGFGFQRSFGRNTLELL